MGRKIFQNGVWYHMENKIEYDTEYMARELIELCPQAPVELLQELRWLYRHQELGAYLCGRGPTGKGEAAGFAAPAPRGRPPRLLGVGGLRPAAGKQKSRVRKQEIIQQKQEIERGWEKPIKKTGKTC